MTEKSEPLVSFRGVAVGYTRHPVLDDVTFDVTAGDLLGVIGPNGGGKTSVLRTLLGVLEPLGGIVTRREGIRFGYVPQQATLAAAWPLSALEVVGMGLYAQIGLFRRMRAEHRRTAYGALEAVGLGSRAGAPFNDLSGGQKQRVLIARALACEPDVLVLDEPTEGMDLPSTTGILDLVGRLHAEKGVAVLLAGHDLNTLVNHVDRIAFVRDGAFVIGDRDALLTPESLRELYGIAVEVRKTDGQRLIFPAEGS